MNFAELTEHFFTLHCAVNNRASEQARKRLIINAHLLPRFGTLPVSEIRPLQVAQLKAELVNEGLAPSTVNNVLSVLRIMLNWAAEMEFISKAPTIKLLPVPKDEARWLSEEEAGALWSQLSGVYHDLVMLGLQTGCRIGELLALRVGDIDAEPRVLTVRRGDVEGEDSTTKSGSLRTIPLTTAAWTAVACRLGDRQDALLFTDNGKRISYARVERIFREACERAGLEGVTLHSLRHTFASRLAIAGIGPQQIAALLGHASLALVQRYAHLNIAAKREAVAVLERSVAPSPLRLVGAKG